MAMSFSEECELEMWRDRVRRSIGPIATKESKKFDPGLSSTQLHAFLQLVHSTPRDEHWAEKIRDEINRYWSKRSRSKWADCKDKVLELVNNLADGTFWQDKVCMDADFRRKGINKMHAKAGLKELDTLEVPSSLRLELAEMLLDAAVAPLARKKRTEAK